MNRPKTYTIAAIIQLAVSLWAVGDALNDLRQGAALAGEIPIAAFYFFQAIWLIIGLAGIFSAYGVWKNQRWGVILTIVLRGFEGLMALPGILSTEPFAVKIPAFIFLSIAVVVIALLLWPREKDMPVSQSA